MRAAAPELHKRDRTIVPGPEQPAVHTAVRQGREAVLVAPLQPPSLGILTVNALVAADDPYKRLPQIRFDALSRNSFLGVQAGLGSEFVNFAVKGFIPWTPLSSNSKNSSIRVTNYRSGCF